MGLSQNASEIVKSSLIPSKAGKSPVPQGIPSKTWKATTPRGFYFEYMTGPSPWDRGKQTKWIRYSEEEFAKGMSGQQEKPTTTVVDEDLSKSIISLCPPLPSGLPIISPQYLSLSSRERSSSSLPSSSSAALPPSSSARSSVEAKSPTPLPSSAPPVSNAEVKSPAPVPPSVLPSLEARRLLAPPPPLFGSVALFNSSPPSKVLATVDKLVQSNSSSLLPSASSSSSPSSQPYPLTSSSLFPPSGPETDDDPDTDVEEDSFSHPRSEEQWRRAVCEGTEQIAARKARIPTVPKPIYSWQQQQSKRQKALFPTAESPPPDSSSVSDAHAFLRVSTKKQVTNGVNTPSYQNQLLVNLATIHRSGQPEFPALHRAGSVGVTYFQGSTSAPLFFSVFFPSILEKCLLMTEGDTVYISGMSRFSRRGKLSAFLYSISLPPAAGGLGINFKICWIVETEDNVWQLKPPFDPWRATTAQANDEKPLMDALKQAGPRRNSVLTSLGPEGLQRAVRSNGQVDVLSMECTVCGYRSDSCSEVRDHMSSRRHRAAAVVAAAAAANNPP